MAFRRITQLAQHMRPAPEAPLPPVQTFEGIPTIRQRGGDSRGPRAKGKVVIITGANSPLGMGRATAHQFAYHEARAIFICDYNDDCLEIHKNEMNKLYSNVDIHPRKFDAGDNASVKGVVDEAIHMYGRLDVFFANAAVSGTWKTCFETTFEEFESTMRTNLTSVFLATKYAAPAMQITSAAKPFPGGSIIATASTAGLRSNGGTTDYSASKAAVINLMQTSSYQLAGTNVRCNALLPGLTETGMTTTVFYEPARAKGTEAKIGQLCPMRRGAFADEIARVVLFLGSDEASYVTGQAWAADGGLSAGLPYKLGAMA